MRWVNISLHQWAIFQHVGVKASTYICDTSYEMHRKANSGAIGLLIELIVNPRQFAISRGGLPSWSWPCIDLLWSLLMMRLSLRLTHIFSFSAQKSLQGNREDTMQARYVSGIFPHKGTSKVQNTLLLYLSRSLKSVLYFRIYLSDDFLFYFHIWFLLLILEKHDCFLCIPKKNTNSVLNGLFG